MAGGRPLRIDWDASDDEGSLKERYRTEQDPQLRPRLHALWLLRTGRSARETAAVIGVHERSVQRWIRWYREGGMGAVCAHHLGGVGQPARLTRAQQAKVVDQAASGAFRTAAEAAAWIRGEFGVSYRASGIYALLHRLRCRPKVPRPIHVQASAETQAAWKRGGLHAPCRPVG
jgi:transposase